MGKQSKVILILALSILLISLTSAVQVCEVYDDFSGDILNIDKWEIRQDIEGQSLMDESWLDVFSENFHTKQNSIGDRRTYLFPKRTFITGNVLEYDFEVLSKEGHYGQMVLLGGDQYVRIGIMGYNNGVQGYDELGVSHVRIEFQENNFHLERTTPSGITLIDNFALTNTDRTYELYIGSFSGHNGRVHIDYDNFTICTEQEEEPEEPEPNPLEQRISELEQRVEELEEENQEFEDRISWLENMIDKIINFIKRLPKGLNKFWSD